MENKNKTIRRKLEGVVVSDKMIKTRVVEVTRTFKHAKYGKFLKRSKHYKAHDEDNKYKMGDKVVIEECRPISRDKHFIIVST
ncbi:MAG TPA: 30S ribosomal protein S17 [Candidatus Paceibacterota bacterium]